MTQDELADENVLIAAIYPFRNVMLNEGGHNDDLIDDLIETKPEVVPGLLKFIESGWKQYGVENEDGSEPEEFGELPRWQQSEMLQEWAYRNVPGDLLIGSVSAPVPKYMEGTTSYSFSWGHAFIGYVAGRTLDEVYAAALAWKEARYEEKKAAA